MGVAADHERLGDVFGSLSVPTAWPNRSFKPPEPTSDPDAPAIWATIDVDYSDPELVDFNGGQARHGQVRVGLWCEVGVGQEVLRAKAAELEAIFAASDTPGFVFLEYVVRPLGFNQWETDQWHFKWEATADFIAQG